MPDDYGLQAATPQNSYGLQPATPQPAPDYGLTPAASAATYGLTPAQPLPPAFSSTLPQNMSVSAAPAPTVWDRIKSVFTEGIPQFSTRTASNPDYGNMQLVTPEAAMTPSEEARHPILTGAGQAVGGMTTPQSAALIAGTGGLGELPGAASVASRLLSAGFSAQAIASAYKTSKAARDAFERGDTSEGERLLTQAVLTAGVGGLGAAHAATGGTFTGKPSETAPRVETRPIPADSLISQVIAEPAPAVHLVDSGPAKQAIENAQTITPPSPTAARVVSQDYVPAVSTDQVLAQRIQQIVNSSAELQRLGVDPAQIKTPEDINAMLTRLADNIRFNADPRLATITFESQKQLAADLGMSVEDLLARKSGTAFNAEQAIASRALLQSSSDRVISLAAQADNPASLKDFTDALAQHQAVMDTVSGMTAEAGRALGSFRITQLPQAKITNALAGLPESAQAEAAKLLSKLDVNDQRAVNDFVQRIKPTTTSDKLFEYYRNALLSSPHIVAVKAASEAAMMALEATRKVVAAGVNKLARSPEERYASESWWYAKGAMQAMAHARDVLTGKFNLQDAPGFEETGQQAIKGPLGTVIRTPSRILSRQTNLMYVLNFFGELNAQAARTAIGEGLDGDAFTARQAQLSENPTPRMTEAAHKLALENTFQSQLGKLGSSASRTIQLVPGGVGRFLIPFFKTPINLIKESSYFSPYGVFKGAFTGDADMVSKGLIGSSIAAGIAKLALDGYVTGGGPVDFRKRETLESTGWQPYSIKIGGRYYSYHRAEPLGLAMSLVADVVHGEFTHLDPEVTQSKSDNAVALITRNVSDFPFLQTLSSLSALTQGDPTTQWERFAGHLASGFVPSALGNVAQMNDRTIRRPTSIPEFIETKIPGITSRVPASIDITGRPAQYPASGLGGANPFPISNATGDPVTAELARLAIPTPQPIKQISAQGHAFAITPAESEAILQAEGRALYSTLSSFVHNPNWATLDDETKIGVIKRVRADAAKDRIVKLAEMRGGSPQTATTQ